MTRDAFDAVVVGSGFGGAITALRLAETGRSVLVLERGRRYLPGEFPRARPSALVWAYPARPEARGLYRFDGFPNVAVLTASGWGGGSLIYANIHIRAPESVFADARWHGIDRASLEPFYDRVAAMLALRPLDAALDMPKRAAFQAAARALGRPVFDPDQAVNWEICRHCSECEIGCQFGAKNTLDLNYLAQAERRGIETMLGANATHVESDGELYRVHATNIETGATFTVPARRVVLAAGTLGTQRILFASRDTYRTLPAVSAALGRGFSANGDFIGTLYGGWGTPALDPRRGPDVTSVMRFDDEPPEFTVAAPTFNVNALAQFSANRDALLSGATDFSNDPDPARTTNLFAIGRDNAGGTLGWRDAELTLDWDYAGENARLVERMSSALGAIARAYGGRFEPLPTWTLARKIVTVHPLGGCAMAPDSQSGVVSLEGEVHGYRGLFVADGSVVPTALGVHPVMTIAALAEWISDRVIASYE